MLNPEAAAAGGLSCPDSRETHLAPSTRANHCPSQWGPALRRILSLFPVFVSVSSPGLCLYAPRPCGGPSPSPVPGVYNSV